MKNENIDHKSIAATKWSTVTEITAKLITPVTNMILARLLAPEAFGVVATASMIFSFADMLTDAGFQKYLVQHEFNNDEEKYQYTNVAFLTNLAFSVFLWVIIFIFNAPIATLVGSPGLGRVIVITCLSLPLTSFSSIQMALYRRDFDYKTLFITRIAGILVPIFVTVPLAVFGFGYWALIIGTICGELLNAIILTIKSKWKPRLFFKFKILKRMFSFSCWSLVEAVSIWLTSWVDIFIVGSCLNSYYLGLYRTSISTVNSIMAVITSSLTSVLFSTLSRYQEDEDSFRRTFFYFQRLVAIFVLPLGIGVFMYSKFITLVLLGSKWTEASQLIGIWGLMSALTIVFAYFGSEVYRSKGKPKLSFLAQVLHLVVLVPALIISVRYGYTALCYTRSLVRIEFIIVHFILIFAVVKISPLKMVKNVLPYCFGSIVILVFSLALRSLGSGTIWDIMSIAVSAAAYFLTLYIIPRSRKEMAMFISNYINKRNEFP